ncbi:MAG: S41 family peptidase [Candidatus Spechtbacterales bacterium]
MRKLSGFLVILALVVSACSAAPSGSPSATNQPSQNADPLCKAVERTRIDFAVLNDVAFLLDKYSVFQDTATNPRLLLNRTHEAIWNYLGVPTASIPQWSRDIVDAEVARSNGHTDFSIFNRVYQELIKDPNYSDLKDSSRLEELVQASIKGVIDAIGDPFASYMSADLYLSGAADNSGSYRGLGVTLRTNSRGEITFDSITEGSPAEKAGIKTGDALLEVNGLSTLSCSVRQFSLLIKSLSDPRLKLTIAREIPLSTERETLTIDVTMETIQQVHLSTYPAVALPGGRGDTHEGVPYRCGAEGSYGIPCPFVDDGGNGYPDVFYIRIHQFSGQMAQDLEYVMSTTDWSLYKGVVVDVRDNPGGWVSATLDAIDFFLPSNDVIFIQQDANGTVTKTRQNRVTYVPEDMPVVILMNNNSYSGAELFAAALRDHGRAVIVNSYESSGGKGSVNRWFTLRNGEYGAVYISFALWLTPNGEMIEKQDLDNDGHYEVGGLSPDIYIPWSDDDFAKNNRDVNYDPTIEMALDYIQEHLSK